MEDANKVGTVSNRELLPDHIFQVYSGRPGCACGCQGTYYCSSAEGAEDSTTYNPKEVTRISRLVAKDPRTVRLESVGGEQVLVLDVSRTRTYSVYLSPDADLSAFPEMRSPRYQD